MQSVKQMFLYPWDVLDEGAAPLARRLATLGVTSVSLAVVYHSGKLLLPHNPCRRVLLHPDNRSYFPFEEKRYGRLRPITGELLGNDIASFWRKTLTTLHAEGIRVCAWVVVFHAHRLALQYPACAEKNAWDEPSPHSLCPSNAEVFDYGLTLLEDIARAGAEELHLESVDYAGFLHGAHHEMQAYADTAELERLLGVCFCPACRERARQAGVDAIILQEQIKQRASHFFNLEPLSPIDTTLCSAYAKLRAARIAEFYAALKKRLRSQGLLTKLKPILWMADGANPQDVGVDPALLAHSVDGMLAVYPSSPENVKAFLGRVRTMLPQDVDLTGGVRLLAPHTVRPQQVSDYIKAYAAQGVNDVIFYNYGMAPRPFLEALAQEEIG